MLSTSLSIYSSYKLLERVFRFFVKSIDRKMQKVVRSKTLAKEMAIIPVDEAKKTSSLRIARTTLPDERLDFNQTFRHIRFGLDELYRERNPIFHSSLRGEVWQNNSAFARSEKRFLKTASQPGQILEIYHKEERATASNPDISPLWIAKTTLPDERRDFNQTFLHIRTEIDKIYKEQNPVFDNTISPELLQNQFIENDQKLNKARIITKTIRLIEQDKQDNIKENEVNLPEPVTSTIRVSETTIPGEEQVLPGAFQAQYSETEDGGQGQQLIRKNVKKEEARLNKASSINPESLAYCYQRADQALQLVGLTLPDASKNRKAGSCHLEPDIKKRKLQRPLRMTWSFKGRKESVREQIPDAINSKTKKGSEELIGNILRESLSHAS